MSGLIEPDDDRRKRRAAGLWRFAPLAGTLLAVLAGIVIMLLIANWHTGPAPEATPKAVSTKPAPTPTPATTSDITGNSTEYITDTASVRMSATALVKLSPGVSSPLNMSFTNIGTTPVLLNYFSVSIVNVTAPNAGPATPCTVNDFLVTQMAKTFFVGLSPATTSTLTSLNTAQTLWPTIGMVDANTNQDGCRGATVLMSYTARGTIQ